MLQRHTSVLRACALPALIALGAANVGCPGNVNNSTTSNAGGGGSGGSMGGDAGNAGEGGTGTPTCVAETEICDMKDNDCDGQVDNVANTNGCQCNDGATQSCYMGPDGTVGVGACVAGQQTCVDGAWAECVGAVVPADEACNLTDDDCNGLVDDMGMATCGVGACAVTVEKCVMGVEQPCVPNQPTLEVCDGLDNNCNQLTDESDPMLNAVCDTGTPGVCAKGKMLCNAGIFACAPDILPSPETCDGLDTDCDGTVDNNIPGTGGQCSTGQLGVCSAGTISCKLSGGSYQIDCFSDVPQSPEACDGLDNDCDGQVDDGNPQGGGTCDTGQLGICAPGTLNCISGAVQCTPDAQAVTETCNGIDDNCNGLADENNPGGGVACGCGGAGITACQNGQLVCNGGPITYFTDDFKDNSKGWTLGPEWAIGPAQASSCSAGNDPSTDHTPTADNGIAGVLIGGCYGTSLHADYCLTSPVVNTSMAQGNVFFSFWRHLHSDYPAYITNKVQISTNGGVSWTNLWTSPAGTFINDANWTQQSYDVTAYKSAQMQVRFCYMAGSGGIISGGGWNVDDVAIAQAVCP